MNQVLYTVGFVMSLILGMVSSYAQQTVITGRVIDADTKEAMPFVNILLKGTSVGGVTDMDGNYSIHTSDLSHTEIQFSFLGYKTIVKKIIPGQTQQINIRISQDATLLQEVEVRAGKEREHYRNKNNPAVDLVREMITHKSQNRIEHYDFAEYEQYEKLQMSISTVSDKLKERKFFRKYQWLFENVDTTAVPGKSLLPIYLQEKLTDEYVKRPHTKKSIVKAEQKVSIDDYIDDQGLSNYLNYLYNEIDIYDNNITLFTNQFLSPIADSAPIFYRFYITDTLKNETPNLVELSFVPRNPGGFLFQGRLYVTLHGNYAVQKLNMTVNKNINLNWVRELFIDQDFKKSEDGRYHLEKSKMRADFGLSKNGGGLYGERLVSLKYFTTGEIHPEEFYEQPELTSERKIATDLENEKILTISRHDSLSRAESKVYQNIDSLQQMPSFKRTLDIATLLLAGYKSFGWWELGPVNTFYSFNPVEGFRLRAGGRTTPKFNEHLYFETYAAYGFKDEKWKYFLSATYSFTGRSIREFPLKTLRVSYQRDTKIPGQELQFVQEDNFLLSFKRGVNDKWLYNNIWSIDYLQEFENHFSYRLGLKNWEQIAAGRLVFGTAKQDSLTPVNGVTTTELTAELRWAPGEQFYQSKAYRIPIPNQYPIFTLRYTAGIKGLINSQYNYHNISMNVYKRFYFSQFGYTDVVAEGGYIAGQIPFPLLSIHRANQTYSYQLQSYNLMNFLEFVSDSYVSVNFDHYFNGFIFNKIPLLKRLKWREVATLKILYGSIRNENNPGRNPELFTFPVNENGQTTTFSLRDEPYIEASVGVANIFKLIRVDAVKRLSYLDNPNVSNWGIRARFKFDF